MFSITHVLLGMAFLLVAWALRGVGSKRWKAPHIPDAKPYDRPHGLSLLDMDARTPLFEDSSTPRD